MSFRIEEKLSIDNNRIIDFKRNKFDVSGEILTVEYDPNRSSRIALVNYDDSEKRYIIAPEGIKVGNKISENIIYSRC